MSLVPRLALVVSLLTLACLTQACSETTTSETTPPPVVTAAAPEDEPLAPVTLPDVSLIDSLGHPVKLRELLAGKTAVVNFVFTRCTTICPPMGLGFSRLQKSLGDRVGKDVALVSITLDPENDTTDRMRAWGERYGARPGWSLLTGTALDIEKILRALGVFTAAKEEHAPIVLVGKESRWVRAYGLSSPAEITRTIARVEASAPPAVAPATKVEPSGAKAYFGDLTLVDQEGKRRSLYTDFVAGKTVVVSSFFTSCAGVCPKLARTLAALQERLGPRLGEDVNILSITVDPENDTPAKLAEYARRFGARRGWYFLTGTQAEVDRALAKIGQSVDRRDDHSPIFIAGNDRTGLWKKALGLADPEAVLGVLTSVADDQRPSGGSP